MPGTENTWNRKYERCKALSCGYLKIYSIFEGNQRPKKTVLATVSFLTGKTLSFRQI